MKKPLLIVVIVVLLSSFATSRNVKDSNEQQINAVLDQWHKAAAAADFERYFESMTSDAVFIGTDASENWNKNQFMAYAKPFFDKGKAWSFTAVERHVYLDKSGKIAWFDELLNTQMKICRGSGVLVKKGKNWKIQHYVLSMTVPNENSAEVIKIKTASEEKVLAKFIEYR